MSKTIPSFIKDPNAILPYYIDWSDWLEDGDILSSSAWVGIGCTIDSDTNDNTKTTAVISGGVAGVAATAKNHVVTSSGYEDDRTLNFTMEER